MWCRVSTSSDVESVVYRSDGMVVMADMDLLARTLMTISCRDCDPIPKVSDAGKIADGIQTMHNGLKVVSGGYYGDWMAHIIRALKGHHEPQEEFIFHHLLRLCRHNSTIVELGAFWAYYSLWYLLEIPGSRAICVEPDPNNLDIGRRNAKLNGFGDRAEFISASIGAEDDDAAAHMCESTGEVRPVRRLNMEAVLGLTSGAEIELMHIDAQGFELPLLTSRGAERLRRALRFLVVSTHHRSISGSATTHEDCLEAIKVAGGHVLVQHSVQESYSGDGLIVASFFSHDRDVEIPQISRNKPERSLFPDT